MNRIISWFSSHAYQANTLAFLLMLLTPLLMMVAVQRGATGWTVFLLACFILGNLVALVTK